MCSELGFGPASSLRLVGLGVRADLGLQPGGDPALAGGRRLGLTHSLRSFSVPVKSTIIAARARLILVGQAR